MDRIEISFEYRYENAVRDRVVSPEIKPFLRTLDNRMIQRPWNFAFMKDALVELLSFLTTSDGRTDGNCRAVDLFVILSSGAAWLGLEDLPKPFEALLFDIGGQLSDTFTAPEIAENFQSLPEQLLERAQNLQMPE